MKHYSAESLPCPDNKVEEIMYCQFVTHGTLDAPEDLKFYDPSHTATCKRCYSSKSLHIFLMQIGEYSPIQRQYSDASHFGLQVDSAWLMMSCHAVTKRTFVYTELLLAGREAIYLRTRSADNVATGQGVLRKLEKTTETGSMTVKVDFFLSARTALEEVDHNCFSVNFCSRSYFMFTSEGLLLKKAEKSFQINVDVCLELFVVRFVGKPRDIFSYC